MVSVTFHANFTKDVNSTKQPGATTIWGTYDCALHEPCSIITPTIILALAMTADLSAVTYAHIPSFNRYYWVRDIQWNDGRWFIYMNVDPLASFKTDIGNSQQYVLRAAAIYDPMISDLHYATKSETRTITESVQTTPFTYLLQNGSFVVGIVNDSPTFGSVHYSVLNMSEFQSLLTFLLSTGSYMGTDILDDMSMDTAKVILNPIQYIVSCKWFPFSVSRTSPGTYIKIGWWTTTILDHGIAQQNAGDFIDSKFIHFLTVPKHPQAAETVGGNERGYLNAAPFSNYHIYLPPVGEVEINSGKMCYANLVDAAYYIDLLTGLATIRISTYRSDYQRQGKTIIQDVPLAVEIPVAQVLQNWRSNAVQAVQQISNGNWESALTNVAQAALGYFVLNGADGAAYGGGSQGYIAPYNWDPYIKLDYVEQTGTNRARFGQPLCGTAPISTLPGYIQCQTAHMEAAGATRSELEEIESYMNGGFFYE